MRNYRVVVDKYQEAEMNYFAVSKRAYLLSKEHPVFHAMMSWGFTVSPLLFTLAGFSYSWKWVLFWVSGMVWIYYVDDFIEGKVKIPLFSYGLIAVSFIAEPLLATLMFVGALGANARAILKNPSFWLERTETLSDFLIFGFPIFYATGLLYWKLLPIIFSAAMMYDSLHKIFHGETRTIVGNAFVAIIGTLICLIALLLTINPGIDCSLILVLLSTVVFFLFFLITPMKLTIMDRWLSGQIIGNIYYLILVGYIVWAIKAHI